MAGKTGQIVTSTNNGVTWTTRSSGTTEHFYRVGNNSDGTFFVSGDAGKILASSDGTTWTSKTSGTSE